VALIWSARAGCCLGQGEAREGFAQLEVALPSLAPKSPADWVEGAMNAVVIGMDSHKRSATIEVMACNEAVLDGGRYGTDASGYRAVRRWQERTWVVGGTLPRG
jgi:hypothetical protein